MIDVRLKQVDNEKILIPIIALCIYTQLGTGGTPAYQGPEVLKRHPVCKKLDLYGFAIMLWEM